MPSATRPPQRVVSFNPQRKVAGESVQLAFFTPSTKAVNSRRQVGMPRSTGGNFREKNPMLKTSPPLR